MQQQEGNKWTSPPETPRNYMSFQSNYPYSNNNHSNEYPQQHNNTLPGMSSQPGLLSGSQPGTPRPDIISPPPPEKLSTAPDLIRRRPPLPSRPASFTTTTFHSNPYPNNVSLRRRRTESSMFSFEAGPTFSQTKQLLDLWNIDQSNGYQVQLHAKMDRGFFRADQDWTCYRRNYFQVSSTFDIHGINYLLQGPEVPCLLRTENQELFQIDFFTIGVTARVSGSDKKIELVQHTPKRDKGPQMIPEPRVVSAGGNLHLASVGSNHNIVTFERMQFKTATANNGKRRAAQQYYEIVVDLYANTSTGKSFKVATTVSAPLVVRGRSPGHYADSHTRYRSMDAGQPSSVVPFHQGEHAFNNTAGRYNPSSNNTNSNNSGPDFGNPYYPQQQTANYPYANFPVLNRNEDDQPPREEGGNYLMHPYHPLSSSQNNNEAYYDHEKPPYWPHRDSTSSEQRYEFSGYHGMRSMSTDNGSPSSSMEPSSTNENRHY